MLLSKLEKQIELGKKLAEAMNWKLDEIDITLGRVEVRLYDNDFKQIILSERSNIKNKILNVQVSDYKADKNIEVLNYKKPPHNTNDYPKQHPPKDVLFHYSLEMKVVITYEELKKLEEIMDEYDDTIFVAIGIGTQY